jgi:hypothetical protein
MAQTISISRGSTTVLGNGTTRTTLFTLSSGTASRIILGGLSFSGGTENQSSCVGSLLININGSGNYLPVLYKSVGGGSYRYWSVFPDTAASNNNGVKIINSAVANLANTTLASDVLNGYATNIFNAQNISSGGNVGGPGAPTNYVPSNFWMANGDSLVVMAGMSSTAQTITVLYHFVIVTES